MKLPRNFIRTAMLCVALAITGCTHEYHQGYGGAYQQAIKEGKTEFQARRIAEAAGNKADEDEEAWQSRYNAMNQANLNSMLKSNTVPGSIGLTPSVGGGSHLQSATGYTTPPVVHQH